MPRKTQYFDADGKHYEFTPGPNGSLIARMPPRPEPLPPLVREYQQMARTVPSRLVEEAIARRQDDEMRKKLLALKSIGGKNLFSY